MSEDLPTIVIDNGSYNCKAGFAEEDVPKCCIRAVVGRPKQKDMMNSFNQKDIYIGNEALAKKGVLQLNYPIQCGIVNDWNDMELILHHVFENELHVKYEEYPVLMTENPKNPKYNREKMIQILFETFKMQFIVFSIALFIYFGKNNWCCIGFWRWCIIRSPNLYRISFFIICSHN